MWNNSNTLIDSESNIWIIGYNIVDDILQDEEQKSEDNADLSFGDKNLDEETLNDQNYIKKKSDYQREDVGNITKSTYENSTRYEMND